MSKHIYAFGSICRGESDEGSDIDLLACVTNDDHQFDKKKFSIYSHDRVKELWKEGNPFAWHLSLESRLLFSSDGSDFLMELGQPSKYKNMYSDCLKFRDLYTESCRSLNESSNSAVFHLSCMFLAVRNFSTCYSFSLERPIFSRKSPLLIDRKLPIDGYIFDIFSNARILSTRGFGVSISNSDLEIAKSASIYIYDWMQNFFIQGVIKNE